MNTATAELLEKAKHLEPRDRIELMSGICDSLDGDIPLSPEHEAELLRRLADDELHPGRAVPWETAKDMIRQKR